MRELANRTCEACTPGSESVAEADRADLLADLADWACVRLDGVDQLVASFDFPDFISGLVFVRHVAEFSEAENHHPRLVLEWGRVEVRWWTHTINGLHMNDFILAARTSALYR